VRLASVSVDLDEIPNYFQIYGLHEPVGPEKRAVYDVALDRLSRFARDAGLPLTLFAIGSDLARPEAAARLKLAREEGHEIANHTLDHRYDLVRLGKEEIRRQIEEGADRIQEATGQRPRGFRAPGYTVSDEVFRVLEELGVQYDSSVFPCPAYWGAKVTAISWIALLGRRSRSIMDRPQVLLAPTSPYRVGKPYWRRGNGLLELPVQVTRGPRLPFYGTPVTLAGPVWARRLTKMCVGEPLVNLELHGIDVLDATDGLEALRSHESNVHVPWEKKVQALHAVVDTLRDARYAFVTMSEAAEQLGSS
jgi:peptidoglycan/xylan/chitin deacetylase (PgdA/CDA1 family)